MMLRWHDCKPSSSSTSKAIIGGTCIPERRRHDHLCPLGLPQDDQRADGQQLHAVRVPQEAVRRWTTRLGARGPRRPPVATLYLLWRVDGTACGGERRLQAARGG